MVQYFLLKGVCAKEYTKLVLAFKKYDNYTISFSP